MDSNDAASSLSEPIIFVIGSTASGKTKLSLELAQTRKEIEIINADALQLYKGADIMTAKATSQERELVQHHILDILPLESLEFTRRDYFSLASSLITDLHKQGKIPLVVGGTNYYIESLLYTDTDQTEAPQGSQTEINELHEALTKNINPAESEIQVGAEQNDGDKADLFVDGWEELPTKEKHSRLAKVDPLIAEKVHPNDNKRVDSYIRVYLEEGVIPSKKLIKINSQRKLRFRNVVIFWVKDQHKDNLSERIKKRVHDMINMTGLREVVTIFQQLDKIGTFDFTRGVLQSIGYKELYDFYKRIKETAASNNIEEPSKVLENVVSVEDLDSGTKKVLEECKRKLITATEQYAKRQLTWIKNRLASDSRLKGRLYTLEFSEATKFNEEVVTKGVGVLSDFFAGKLIKDEEDDEGDVQREVVEKYKTWKRFTCDVCEVDLSGKDQWETHLKSKKHKKMKEKSIRHQKNMERKLQYEQSLLNKKPELTGEVEDDNQVDNVDTGGVEEN